MSDNRGFYLYLSYRRPPFICKSDVYEGAPTITTLFIGEFLSLLAAIFVWYYSSFWRYGDSDI